MQPLDALSRRRLLALGAAAALAPRRRGRRRASVGPTADPFTLGVCSGDPDERSAVLWTRLTGPDGDPLDGDVPVTWELATDDGFASLLDAGEVVARADEGHSLHVIAELDGPARFRFRSGEWTSPVGRVAPSPAPGSEAAGELRLATASCQHWETGFYAAHRDLAGWGPDLVLFLGDFIYEYGDNPLGGTVVRRHDGPEVTTLEDYRRRYAQYLSDPDLRAARAACPWLAIWDDHEVDNNYAERVPEQPAEADGFAARRLAGYQAWWEHMPVRLPRPSTDELVIHRRATWGDLADLLLLDGRQYRSDQACGDATLQVDPPCDEVTDGDRTMLGFEQERWLLEQLGSSTATWAVLGQQTVLSDVRLPNGAILNFDQWDGYDAARRRLLLAAAPVDRIVVLTGDIHLAGVGVLEQVGVEFVTTSVTSPGLVPADFEELVNDFASIVAAELTHRGYTRHVVTPAAWTAEYRIVADVTDVASAVSTWRTFAVDAGSPLGVREIGDAAGT